MLTVSGPFQTITKICNFLCVVPQSLPTEEVHIVNELRFFESGFAVLGPMNFHQHFPTLVLYMIRLASGQRS